MHRLLLAAVVVGLEKVLVKRRPRTHSSTRLACKNASIRLTRLDEIYNANQ
jgi:hypothetical protein